jgi:FdhD protein
MVFQIGGMPQQFQVLMKSLGIQPRNFIQVTSDRWEANDGAVIEEKAVSLTVNGEIWLTFMCTPIDLEAMAVGFLYNEDYIQSYLEIADIRLCPGNENIDVWLNKNIPRPKQWRRTSGCTGGMTSVNDLGGKKSQTRLLTNGGMLTPAQVESLISQLLETQTLYRQSGGVHTSALSDGKRLVYIAEDVGRHNTLDKLAGMLLLKDQTMPHKVLLTTGRISSEMLQKAARLGASFVISRTAATSLSIQFAEQWGITLIGYARRDRFQVYTHAERILSTRIETRAPNKKGKHAQTNL